MDSKSSLFDTLWALIQHTLGIAECDVLPIVHRRMAAQSDSSSVTEQLLDLDDGLQMLDRKEAEEVVKEQKKIKGQELHSAMLCVCVCVCSHAPPALARHRRPSGPTRWGAFFR